MKLYYRFISQFSIRYASESHQPWSANEVDYDENSALQYLLDLHTTNQRIENEHSLNYVPNEQANAGLRVPRQTENLSPKQDWVGGHLNNETVL